MRSLADLEKPSIVDALQRAKGNKSRAAAMLGLSRTQFYTRLRRFGLAADRSRRPAARPARAIGHRVKSLSDV